MSDEVEKAKEDPDFMLHQAKPVGRKETDEAEEGEDEDFELHQYKPVGDIVEKNKEV